MPSLVETDLVPPVEPVEPLLVFEFEFLLTPLLGEINAVAKENDRSEADQREEVCHRHLPS